MLWFWASVNALRSAMALHFISRVDSFTKPKTEEYSTLDSSLCNRLGKVGRLASSNVASSARQLRQPLVRYAVQCVTSAVPLIDGESWNTKWQPIQPTPYARFLEHVNFRSELANRWRPVDSSRGFDWTTSEVRKMVNEVPCRHRQWFRLCTCQNCPGLYQTHLEIIFHLT